MKKYKYILAGILILATLSCSIFSPDKKNEEQSVYENDAFSFSIPAGWKMALFGGDFYDLNVEMLVTVYDNPIMFWSKALFTVASAPLEGDLETRFTQTYENIELYDTPTLEVEIRDFEKDDLSGMEIFYSHQSGEKIYSFHDIWLENNGSVFVLSFYTQPGEFDNYSVVFDQILESFHFNE